MLYVAVVLRESNTGFRSGTSNGGWTGIVGEDREDVVRRAIKHARESTERNSARSGMDFSVYVGTLTHKAEQPVTYELIPIKDGE
jgi:hypothetical protein